jgi:hypothetical protein
MLRTEFVSVYLRTQDGFNYLTAHEDQLGVLDAGQLWGQRFGMVAHDHLSGKKYPEMTRNGQAPTWLSEYNAWSEQHTFVPGEHYDTTDEAVDRLHRNNFHVHMGNMLDLWQPVFDGTWGNHPRVETMRYTHDMLAIEGVTYFLQREKFIKDSGGSHVLFDDAVDYRHRQAVGFAQENDATLTLLHGMLHGDHYGKSTTVIPGPPQFEHHAQRYNADHLVIDTAAQRAVGTQSKSRVSQEKADAIDEERIVLIDGRIDLENDIAVRYRKASSHLKNTSWPGIIAAHKVLDLDLNLRSRDVTPLLKRAQALRKEDPHIVGRTTRRLIELQDAARDALGGVRLDMDRISTRVNERVANKLYS